MLYDIQGEVIQTKQGHILSQRLALSWIKSCFMSPLVRVLVYQKVPESKKGLPYKCKKMNEGLRIICVTHIVHPPANRLIVLGPIGWQL